MTQTDPFLYAADLIDPPDKTWRPLPHQLPPMGWWFGWLLLGGRGAGKTAACSNYFYQHIMGPPCDPSLPGGHWPSIIAPTLADGVTSCVYGPSGLRLHDPGVKVTQAIGGAEVRFSNGVKAKIFGAHTPEDVERLRSGGNRCCVWAEELAAWRYMDDCWQHMRYGLRLGPRPHWIASTTPKNRTLIKKLVLLSRDPELPENEQIVLSHATTADNPHLPGHIRKMLYEDYGGTRLGRQELLAEILEDVEGALWNMALIDRWRVGNIHLAPHRFDRIAVGVDPGPNPVGDETGIIVDGMVREWNTEYFSDLHLPKMSHGFVLADYSVRGDTSTWANAVVDAFRDWKADIIVAEINNGGDMVRHTLHTIDPTLPVKVEHATRGKEKRAQPVVNQYEQGRWHHVGTLGILEDQMVSWDANDPQEDWSPDRMDAHVWAATNLMPAALSRITKSRDRRHDGRR